MDDAGWDEYASSWDSDAGAQAYASAAHQSLLQVLADRRRTLAGARVLDFGCGTGLLTERIVEAARVIDAVDTSPAMLAVLRSKIDERGWDHVRPAAEVPDGSYDLIVASSVCSFVDDYGATVGQLVTLLRPGGVFVQWDWEADPDGGDAHGLTRTTVHDTLTRAGLEDVAVETAFCVAVDDARMEPLIGVGTKPDRATG